MGCVCVVLVVYNIHCSVGIMKIMKGCELGNVSSIIYTNPPNWLTVTYPSLTLLQP